MPIEICDGVRVRTTFGNLATGVGITVEQFKMVLRLKKVKKEFVIGAVIGINWGWMGVKKTAGIFHHAQKGPPRT